MRTSTLLLFSITLLSLFLSSCGKQPDPVDLQMPDIGIPMEIANQHLEIVSLDGLVNTFKNGKFLILNLKFLNYSTLHFADDFGIRIFLYQNEQWVEIQNKAVYPIDNPDSFVRTPFGDHTIFAVPYQAGLQEAAPARLTLVGNVMRLTDITDEQWVGTFDFVLKP